MISSPRRIQGVQLPYSLSYNIFRAFFSGGIELILIQARLPHLVVIICVSCMHEKTVNSTAHHLPVRVPLADGAKGCPSCILKICPIGSRKEMVGGKRRGGQDRR